MLNKLKNIILNIKSKLFISSMNFNKKNQKFIFNLPIPKKFIIPVEKTSINVGQYVFRGQRISSNKFIYAPTSGFVYKIQPYIIPNISSNLINTIFLKADEKDLWYENKLINYHNFSKKFFLKILIKNGIILNKKLYNSFSTKKNYILIINICENSFPKSDKIFMETFFEEIIEGIKIFSEILKINKVFFFIDYEDKKIFSRLERIKKNNEIKFLILFNQKQKIIKKIEINFLSNNLIKLNVYDFYAIKRFFINGETITQSVVTIIEKSIFHILVRNGTPINHLLLKMNIYSKIFAINSINTKKRFILSSYNFPILNSTNSIFLLPLSKKIKKITLEKPCIHCEKCKNICPVNIFPNEIYFHIKRKNYINVETSLKKCIECNACEYTCPSNIPLVQYFKKAKNEINIKIFEKNQKKQSKIRFEAKKKRLKKKKFKPTLKDFNNKELLYKRLVHEAILRSKLKKNYQKKLL